MDEPSETMVKLAYAFCLRSFSASVGWSRDQDLHNACSTVRNICTVKVLCLSISKVATRTGEQLILTSKCHCVGLIVLYPGQLSWIWSFEALTLPKQASKSGRRMRDWGERPLRWTEKHRK